MSIKVNFLYIYKNKRYIVRINLILKMWKKLRKQLEHQNYFWILLINKISSWKKDYSCYILSNSSYYNLLTFLEIIISTRRTIIFERFLILILLVQRGSYLNKLASSTLIWFSMTNFTFNRFLSSRAYKSFHIEHFLTLLIKVFEVAGLLNSSILSIFLLNLVDSPPNLVMPKSYVELLLVGLLVLNCDTSLV